MDKHFKRMKEDMELRGFTEQTKEAYTRRVLDFFKHAQKKPEDISRDDIRSYILFLKDDKKLSAGTINAIISAIKFFFSITLDKENVMNKIPRMRGYKPLPVAISKDEVLEIIAQVSSIRNRVILMLMYGSGLRVSEVVRLKPENIDGRNMQIFIEKCKNKSDRYAILSQNCLETLREYWLKCNKPKLWLFPGSKSGEHLHIKTVKNIIINIRTKLRLKKKISAHSFRHAFAVHLLEEKTDSYLIKELLGHKSLKSTHMYLSMTAKTMMKIKSPLD